MERTSLLQQRKTKETTGSPIRVQICPPMMTDVIKENSQDAQLTDHQLSKIHTQKFKVLTIRQPSLRSTKRGSINSRTHKKVLKARGKSKKEMMIVLKRNK